MSAARRGRPAAKVADDGAPAAVAKGVVADDGVPERPGEIVLASRRWRLGVLPGLGGCWSFGQVSSGGRWVDLLRPTPDGELANPEATSSFPLIPWSNRIRDGVLEWGGDRFQLVRNGPDGTAMHGAVRQLPWQIAARSRTGLDLRFSSCDVVGVNWPWRFSARQQLALTGDALTVKLSVTNDDDVAFPAGLGHHPYFVRRLGDKDAVLTVDAVAGYELDAGMAVSSAGAIPARANFRKPRPLGAELVDDVLTGLGPVAARWHYPDAGVEVALRGDGVFSHLVVYLPVGADHFAVEPVTHVNDGMALFSRGVVGTGVQKLEPGRTLTASFALEVRAVG